ncbi:YciI-like protein [Sphingomonas jeddahensis]|uniref:YciI-like protein n=1 Tax=Sphingomonas jeddahensis TaxID=1915074 RepID=A0A1V2ERB8_9SPHN|nr:YciI-like protein [Sphingomonas jeddahensis]ONF95037.1 YciI-like protein [Sphingomonas jeddahensis]
MTSAAPAGGHWLLRYDLAPDYLARRGEFRAAHLALAWEAADKGALLLGGAVGEPVESALLLFNDRGAAEAFARADPYVAQGLVTGWRVLRWHTVVGDTAATPVRLD